MERPIEAEALEPLPRMRQQLHVNYNVLVEEGTRSAAGLSRAPFTKLRLAFLSLASLGVSFREFAARYRVYVLDRPVLAKKMPSGRMERYAQMASALERFRQDEVAHLSDPDATGPYEAEAAVRRFMRAGLRTAAPRRRGEVS